MRLELEQILMQQKHNLTVQQLDVLAILSKYPGGLTNSELTRSLGKKEQNEGDVKTNAVDPLVSSGFICKKKFKYPSFLLFINPNARSLQEIKTQLETKIFYYYFRDREKTEECRKKRLWLQEKQQNGISFDCHKPITQSHKEIRDRLVNYLFLHKQIDEMHWNLIPERGNEVDIVVPKCKFCRNLRNSIVQDSNFEEKSKLHDEVETWVTKFPFQYKHPYLIPNEILAIWEQDRRNFFNLMGWISKKDETPK